MKKAYILVEILKVRKEYRANSIDEFIAVRGVYNSHKKAEEAAKKSNASMYRVQEWNVS